jgi:hypothetical protein
MKLKSLVSFVLLFCLIAPFTGAYLALRYQLLKNSSEVLAKLKTTECNPDLILLKFSSSEAKAKLKWHKNDEFEFKRDMYDIVKQEINQDSSFFWCYKDNKETKIRKDFKLLVNNALNGDSPKKNGSKISIDFFKLICLSSFNYLYTESPLASIASDFIATSYFINKFSPPKPPPKIC